MPWTLNCPCISTGEPGGAGGVGAGGRAEIVEVRVGVTGIPVGDPVLGHVIRHIVGVVGEAVDVLGGRDLLVDAVDGDVAKLALAGSVKNRGSVSYALEHLDQHQTITFARVRYFTDRKSVV